TRETPLSCIRLAGGAAKSKLWAQMFADVMETPVEVVDVGETGALGCAIAAAVAVGEYVNFAEASNQMIRVSGRFLPNKKLFSTYRKKYMLYQKTNTALDSVWDEMQSFMESEKI
ncbi:MAG: FGGY-family carbohydrate kinase, partial [Oscillospiraceae bacterium]